MMPERKKSVSNLDKAYEKLMELSIAYRFKSGEGINEGKLAKRLGISHTPLREALKRQPSEGFREFISPSTPLNNWLRRRLRPGSII